MRIRMRSGALRAARLLLALVCAHGFGGARAQEASENAAAKWQAAVQEAKASGGAAIESQIVAVTARPGTAGPVVWARGAIGAGTRVELVLSGEGGQAKAITAVESKRLPSGEESLLVTAGDLRAELKVKSGGPAVTVESAAANGFLEVRSASRYAAVPAFEGNDTVYDPARIEKDAVLVSADNLVMGFLEGGRAMTVCVWPGLLGKAKEGDGAVAAGKPVAGVELLLEGAGEARRIAATRIAFANGVIHVAVLERAGIWHDEDVSGLTPGTPSAMEWKRPFDGQWRADMLVAQRATQKEGGDRTLTFVQDPKETCPAYFKGDTAFLNLPGEGNGVFGRALLYAFERDDDTPLNAFTLADVMRHTLGLGPCEYVLDLASAKETQAPGGGDGKTGTGSVAAGGGLEGAPPDSAEQATLRKELADKGYIYMPLENQLFRMKADGTDRRMIWRCDTKSRISVTQVSWDGRWVAVVEKVSDSGGKSGYDMHLVAHDGTKTKEVFKDPGSVFQSEGPYCAWTPDSAWLVVAYGNRVDAVRCETGEVKKVLEAEGKGARITFLSADRQGTFYFWNVAIKGNAFSLDKDCNVVKDLYDCGMWTACQPKVSPDGTMMARHHHDYETNDGHKRGYIGTKPGPDAKGRGPWHYLPDTDNFPYRGTHNMPFWSFDGAYIGYTYIPNVELLAKQGFKVQKDFAVLVVCRTTGGPMVWLTPVEARNPLQFSPSCSWGPVPE